MSIPEQPSTEGPSGDGAFRISDPRQRRIVRRLELVGPGPAGFFHDACRLIESRPSIPSTTHLVAHLLRELESALRDVLESVAEKEERRETKCAGGDDHSREILAILKALDINADDPVAIAWLKFAKRETGLNRWAHRDGLARPRPVDAEFRKVWDTMQAILDFVLERLEQKFLGFVPILDRLLSMISPGDDDIKQLRDHVPSNFVLRRYFFDTLSSPSWLLPLKEAGFFDHPPPPLPNPEEGTLGYSPWPEAFYLSRMASRPDAQEQVLDALLSVPDSENLLVNQQLLEVALQLPSELAARLIPKVKRWTDSAHSWLDPAKLSEFVLRLAGGGHAAAVIDLVSSLLAPTKGSSREQRDRLEDWRYEKLTRGIFPQLASHVGEPALSLVCDLAESALKGSTTSGDEAVRDHSHTWRPAIEDHAHNRAHGPRDVLVDAVRDVACRLITINPADLRSVVDRLEARTSTVFRRVALYVLRIFPEGASALVADRLTDRTIFDGIPFRHEYSLLAHEQFAHLSLEQKNTILSWIEEGPDIQRYRRSIERSASREPTSEELDSHRTEWQRNRLAPIQHALPAEWKARFRSLISTSDEPFQDQLASSYTGVHVGPTSPKSLAELEHLSVNELAAYLREWTPPGGWFAPTPEGLGRVISQLVSLNPDFYAAAAREFIGLDATYVHAFLTGLRGSIAKSNLPDWTPLLDLCDWVVEQPREIPGRSASPFYEAPDWIGARRSVADLFAALFADGTSVPLGLRARSWQLLRELTEDPDPTQEDETPREGSSLDPVSIAISSTRGAAMHAVARYALWVRRHLERLPDGPARLARGFDEMPEVREVLDKHLELKLDPSVAVRSVYGQWFPWLFLLDPHWVKANVDGIFPEGHDTLAYWQAAWDAYVRYCPPFDSVFGVLKHKYQLAIDRLGANTVEARNANDAREHFAEHLMVFYGRGLLDTKETDALIGGFFREASATLRGHAISYVGRDLEAAPDVIPSPVLERFRALWEARVAACASNPAAHRDELVNFGWWFVSGRFDMVWAMSQLRAVLSLTGRVEPDHLVVEKLGAIACEQPVEAVDCLTVLIDNSEKPWFAFAWRDDIRLILRGALASADLDAHRKAVELINRLAALGHLEFRDLLTSDT